MRPIAPFVAVCLSLLLAACAGTAGRLTETRVGECPRSIILGDADQVMVFSGPGRDLPDLQYEATVMDLSSQCDYGREWGRRYAFTQMRIDFAVELGSAAAPVPVDIPYFVAVVLPESEVILTKEVFTFRADFGPGYRAMTVRENIDQVRIPVEEDDEAGQYELIVGFELTPEQLAFNRRRDQQ